MPTVRCGDRVRDRIDIQADHGVDLQAMHDGRGDILRKAGDGMSADPASDRARLPHAALDRIGRVPKAEKIFRLLGLELSAGRPARVLEVGTGSGVIAHYFASKLGDRGEVDAVDIVDQRVECEGYRFQKIEGTALPFADGIFDAVISNHVIEHVGGSEDQLAHLRELARVLRADGKGYLAVPSRWQVVEPHYRLAFLSWLPRGLRSGYLRLRGRGAFYDCEPLRSGQIEAYFRASGMQYRNLFALAMHALADVEGDASMAAKLAAKLPHQLLHALRALSPTHIYLFGRDRRAIGHG
jgi:ubiquinone/menaquinone biosynthesis C-methylase UbiE